MKRQKFIKQIEEQGCEFVRHGGRHDVYRNPSNGRKAPVPRHREIADSLCKVICKQLGLDEVA